MTVLTQNIPAELKGASQWVRWRNESDRNGKPTKIPYKARSGDRAESNNPETWAAYTDALAGYQQEAETYSGIGFCFDREDPYCGIDLDACLDADGNLKPEAAEIIAHFPTYAEISPSGVGIKLFCIGELPRDCKHKVENVGFKALEVYNSGRYFTVTGNQYPGSPDTITDCQEGITWLVEKYLSRKKPVTPPAPPAISTPIADGMSTLERCRRYVAAMPEAISGSGGSNAALAVAAETARFGLDDVDAWAVFCEYNARCSPPWSEREIQHKLTDGRQKVRDGGEWGCRLVEPSKRTTTSTAPATVTVADARPPAPLESPGAPPLDAALLPGWMGDMVTAVAAATETPPELAACFCLGTISTVCAQTYSVMVEPGYFEPLCSFGAAVLPSGSRKTAAAKAATWPLIEWERDQSLLAAEKIKRVEADNKTAAARLAHLRARAAKASTDDYRALAAEIRELEAAAQEIPVSPRLFADDVTPEHLGTMLAGHGERMAIISDEAGIFDLMGGRYSNGLANLDVFLKAFSGSPIRVDRGSRPPVVLDHPQLTIAISPQPSALQALTSHKAFRGRGLLARFWFWVPKSNLGFRRLDARPVPRHVSEAYAAGVLGLLNHTPKTDDLGRKRPNVIRLDVDAWQMWKAYAHEVEAAMRPGERLHHITDWAGKAPGGVARIAGLLHCVNHAMGKPDGAEVAGETMERALAIGKLLEAHALVAFDEMAANPNLEGARRIWAWIEKRRRASFTVRDCFNDLRRPFPSVDDMESPLALLVDTGHIFEPPLPSKVGRPSRIYHVNPIAVEGWRRD